MVVCVFCKGLKCRLHTFQEEFASFVSEDVEDNGFPVYDFLVDLVQFLVEEELRFVQNLSGLLSSMEHGEVPAACRRRVSPCFPPSLSPPSISVMPSPFDEMWPGLSRYNRRGHWHSKHSIQVQFWFSRFLTSSVVRLVHFLWNQYSEFLQRMDHCLFVTDLLQAPHDHVLIVSFHTGNYLKILSQQIG